MSLIPNDITEAELMHVARVRLEKFQAMGLLEFVRVPVGPVVHSGHRKKNPMKGLGDWLVWFKDGPVVPIELKTKTGKLESSQVEFKARLEVVGHPYRVAHSIFEFDSILNEYLKSAVISRTLKSNGFAT